MNLLRRNHDGERQRLPPPYPEREGNNQFIEGVNGRFYNNPQPIQPMHVDGQGDVLNLRPEVLYPMNQREASSNQQEFVDSTLEQVALKKRTHGQYISDESFRQPRSKDDPVDQSHLRQPPAKKALEDNPLGSQDQWKESIKYSGPVNQDLSDSHAELKENQLPDLKTSVNMSQFPGKTKEKKESTEEEKNQQLIKENGLADHVGNGPETLITSAEHVGAQGTTFSPTESQMPNPYLNVEDIYTDPGNEEYSETLSFVILEEPETFQDELSIKQTVVS
uniref:Uncharacterized protein n=2 Tax=Pyxicephalus adspersus TaxID=30357 RepID=A0AAV3A3S0_PYXAD|nr:TPA: hypothetical protein GDO54_016473 [Pyxicephalus adspersus]